VSWSGGGSCDFLRGPLDERTVDGSRTVRVLAVSREVLTAARPCLQAGCF
jgi:hypothetical protein